MVNANHTILTILSIMFQIVGIGLCSVFELIRETRQSQPELCTRALQALLDMLQGQNPEGLKNEPQEVIGKISFLDFL